MSKTNRDKDFHFLRNSEKYQGDWHRSAHVFRQGLMTTEIAEREAQYDKVWAKYGMKSMVSDKRRRCSTRKANQKVKQMVHQIDRAKNKKETQHLIKEYYDTFE